MNVIIHKPAQREAQRVQTNREELLKRVSGGQGKRLAPPIAW